MTPNHWLNINPYHSASIFCEANGKDSSPLQTKMEDSSFVSLHIVSPLIT